MIHKIAEMFGMESNGYASIHTENFNENHDLPCYIPENAEDKYDIFSRNDIKRDVIEWLDREDTKEYLKEVWDGFMPEINDELINSWVEMVYDNISWEFPSTYLENFLMAWH